MTRGAVRRCFGRTSLRSRGEGRGRERGRKKRRESGRESGEAERADEGWERRPAFRPGVLLVSAAGNLVGAHCQTLGVEDDAARLFLARVSTGAHTSARTRTMHRNFFTILFARCPQRILQNTTSCGLSVPRCHEPTAQRRRAPRWRRRLRTTTLTRVTLKSVTCHAKKCGCVCLQCARCMSTVGI